MCSQADDPSQHVSDDTLRAALDRDRGPQTPDRCTWCGVPFASHPLTDACAIAQEARDAEAFLAASATDDRDGPCPTCGCDGIHDAASATEEPTPAQIELIRRYAEGIAELRRENDRLRALAASATDEGPRPSATWHPEDRRVIALMAPIGEDGRCTGCDTKPSRETGSCRCLFKIDAAIRHAASTTEEPLDPDRLTAIYNRGFAVGQRLAASATDEGHTGPHFVGEFDNRPRSRTCPACAAPATDEHPADFLNCETHTSKERHDAASATEEPSDD